MASTEAAPAGGGSKAAMFSGGALLVLLHAALGATQLYNPELLAQHNPTPCFAKDACMLLVRFNGLFQFLMVASAWSIVDAVKQNHLASATYGRLMLGLVLWGVGQMAALHLSAGAWTASNYTGGVMVTSGLSVLYGLLMYQCNQAGGLMGAVSPSACAKLLCPSGVISLGYISIALCACLAAPWLLGTADAAEAELFPATFANPFARLMLRHAGGSLLAVVPAACTLKDAYERSRIWASTFQNLNFGLAVLYGGLTWIMGIATSADLIRVTVLSQGIMWAAGVSGFIAAYQYMYAEDPAKKAQEGAEQEGEAAAGKPKAQ